MYGQDTGTNLKFDLTNAMEIPGLFAQANTVVAEACSQDAIIIDVSGTRITVKADKKAAWDNMTSIFKGISLTDEEVSADREERILGK